MSSSGTRVEGSGRWSARCRSANYLVWASWAGVRTPNARVSPPLGLISRDVARMRSPECGSDQGRSLLHPERQLTLVQAGPLRQILGVGDGKLGNGGDSGAS